MGAAGFVDPRDKVVLSKHVTDLQASGAPTARNPIYQQLLYSTSRARPRTFSALSEQFPAFRGISWSFRITNFYQA